MELLVKSLAGSYLVSGLEDGTTIADLKRLLHQQHSQAPEPEEQCLVGAPPGPNAGTVPCTGARSC